MTPDRYQQLSTLYHAALARDPGSRDAFVRHACGDDTGLREELESLLDQDAATSSPECPAVEHAAGPFHPNDLAEGLAGRRFGAYNLQTLMGAGGMGEVYRAHDSTLDRDVAIKILSPEFVADADRVARFEREARVLAKLNHPNIGAIYCIEETSLEGGRLARALVLEFVEGETLADRIGRGPIAVADALDIARHI